MAGDQEFINGTESTANVEHAAVRDVVPLEQARDLGGTAGGQKPLAPEELEQRLHARVVFADLARLIDLH